MILNNLRIRRSKRQYSNQSISKEIIDNIIETALRAPSSRGKRPWEFYVISNKDVLTKLAVAKEHGASFLKDVPLAIAIVADPDVCDVWVEDCSIAAILLQTCAEEEGLGTCWVQFRKRQYDETTTSEEYVKDVLKLKDNMRVPFVIGMGYSEEKLKSVTKEELLFDKIHYID